MIHTMRIRSRRALRLFFATDIHGSETCFRKFLNCGDYYDADVLILGGDMTGKGLVPIVDNGRGRYSMTLQDQPHAFDEHELPRFERMIRERGLYPFRTTDEELAELETDPARLDTLFHRAILDVVEQWVAVADERLGGSNVRAFVCPGNDDSFEIDDVIKASEQLELGEGRAIDLVDGFQLLSTGWSNRTPWNTDREEDEEDMARRIDAMLADATPDPERLIFNFHCPPYGTALDEAPQLTEDLGVVGGGRVLAHVGSTAVREAIQRVQPILGLHGHIHEARGTARLGRTISINPGSSYETGDLQGAVVELEGQGKVKRYQLTIG
jgi:Icc-related predicted phosphoesterase